VARKLTGVTDGATPRVAVVVSTYNRSRLLPRLVAALEAQQDAPPFRVVLVDNASTDDTASVLADLAARTTLDLTVLRQSSNAGPAPARDAGWRAAQASYIAFTDDDCVPEPRWLAEMCEALDSADIVQGKTIPNPAQVGDLGPFSRTVEVPAMDGYFQTCNVGYRRDWLQQVDGFDLRFAHSCEDTDLAWRMIDDGAQAVFAAAAVVCHDVRPSNSWRLMRDAQRWQDIPLAVRVHPHLRDLLHSRYFWKPSHPVALAAAVGALVSVAPGRPWRRVAGLALTLPYVKHRLYDAPLPHTGKRRRRLKLVPAALAVDLAEVAVLAAASVRYRSPVL